MPDCDKVTCGDPADVLAHFPDADELRRYCEAHYDDLEATDYLRIELVGPVAA